MTMTNHIHYYDWIVSWEFNSDGNLIFSIGKSNSIEEFRHYFNDVPDVARGLYECKKAIDTIRRDQRESIQPQIDLLKHELFVLKHPISEYQAPAFDSADIDVIPF
jgi:hypothetical protein